MKIIDLSETVSPGMVVYPGDPTVEHKITHTIKSVGCRLSQLIINSHAGTHIDAPLHFIENSNSIADIALDKCVGKAIVINCTNKKENDSITIEDLKSYESKITKGSKILIRTDWYKQKRNEDYFYKAPRISCELSAWLVEKQISMIGVESPAVNCNCDNDEGGIVHKNFLENNIVIVERLSNLDKIENDEVFFSAAPIAFDGADGTTVRAYAIEFDNNFKM